MNHESLTGLLRAMIAAGRIKRLPARTPWPMHDALVSLYEEAGRVGLRGRAGLVMTITPSPEAGKSVSGADAALRSLIGVGLLHEVGTGLNAELEIDEHAAVVARRTLLSMDAEVVALLQRAGERWAASASTCAKYAASATASPSATVASATA